MSLPRSLMLFACLFGSAVTARERGFAVRKALKASGIDEYDAGKNHALVIGIDTYKHWSPLRCARHDAGAFRDILIKLYGFPRDNVKELLDGDATRDRILEELYKFKDLAEDENLVIYYAGHGYLDEATQKGSWVPVNAPRNEPWKYLSCTQLVEDHLRRLRARHILMFIDSCFSGAFLRDEMPEFYKGAYRYKSRWAITSGGLKPVPDSGAGKHSVFNFKLQQYLRGELPQSKHVFAESDLFSAIAPQVTEFSSTKQLPAYGKLADPNHAGGHFVFCRAHQPSAHAQPKPEGLLRPLSIGRTSISIPKTLQDAFRSPSRWAINAVGPLRDDSSLSPALVKCLRRPEQPVFGMLELTKWLQKSKNNVRFAYTTIPHEVPKATTRIRTRGMKALPAARANGQFVFVKGIAGPVLDGTFTYDPGRLHALFIGIDDYVELPDLRNAVKDCESLRNVLSTDYGFSPRSQTVLINEQATRSALLGQAETLSRLGREDCLLVFFAGHGMNGADGRPLWAPHDGDSDSGSWLPVGDFLRALTPKNGAPGPRHLLIICDAGMAGHGMFR